MKNLVRFVAGRHEEKKEGLLLNHQKTNVENNDVALKNIIWRKKKLLLNEYQLALLGNCEVNRVVSQFTIPCQFFKYFFNTNIVRKSLKILICMRFSQNLKGRRFTVYFEQEISQ